MKTWITLNEPRVTSLQGYGDGSMAPGVLGIGTTAYISAHNQVKTLLNICGGPTPDPGPRQGLQDV